MPCPDPFVFVNAIPQVDSQHAQTRRVGFMAGEVCVPDDFDLMGRTEIELLFSRLTTDDLLAQYPGPIRKV